ncbi:MAG: PQQ-binding-like beta-propeller repeat protein [bacterium]|nr:PQQ-binding-like beta-propeller repeat protein [bacterium]
MPPDVAAAAADWPLPNRDHLGTRATTASPITAANVATLVPAWAATIPPLGLTGALATNPLVVGDTVFVQDLLSNLYAFERATGAARWSVAVGYLSVGPNGAAIGYGRVYAVVGRNLVAAFDAGTGAEQWRVEVPATATEGIDLQPVVYDRRLYVSTVPVSVFGQFTGGDRGVLHALDVDTGAIVWSFDTVDSPDLWGNPQVNSGGGAWFPPAIDAMAGVTYWGTGNPAPFPGIAAFPNASSRPGPNLYTNCALAVDAGRGTLRWYRQVQPRDLFDHDFHLTMLADVAVAGGARRLLVGTGKAGYVHAFDAADGMPLWRTAVGEHVNDDLLAVPLEPTFVKPGLLGGVMTPPAYADGTIYVAVNDMATPYQGDREDHFSFFPYVASARGDLVALDAASGVVQWTQPLPAAAFGAATVVNDVVLTTAFDGSLHAFARHEGGRPLWSVKAGDGINGWPAVAGDLVLVPVGLGSPAQLVAYRLPAGVTTAR